ncbi:hypothetical protein E4U47_004982 [Claviceps purpurea]|nr:hypothetical protein E4U38_008228 [Claviceps purpurea]KAG6155364.1 hypothetical protein E4U37_001236 [Claviceps purpurea]KAG6186888.1 hypothetical protein E4U10_005640 [Claviceps purpurea]KAG6267987.1 hypothetical protein E4U47_004982 [Claviceps purpurea]KAG6316491.1 hypothetical protein E4U44_000655 [Claviceps purpurea]
MPSYRTYSVYTGKFRGGVCESALASGPSEQRPGQVKWAWTASSGGERPPDRKGQEGDRKGAMFEASVME